MMSEPACHLFVILAREAHQAVILRRGPRIWTQLIVWDTDADTFSEGQWFKGTIYKERCDLSPDGSKLVYFSAKHYKVPEPDPDPSNARNWTAISRPPYYTALALWPAWGTGFGGGYFEDDNILYLDDLAKEAILNQPFPEDFEVRSARARDGWTDGMGLYYGLLLEKRGWSRTEGDMSWSPDSGYAHRRIVWRKESPDGAYSLIWTKQLGDRNARDEYRVLRHQDSAEFVIDGHEWADLDHRGRLVYVNSGGLYTGILRPDSIEPVRLADFTSNQVSQIVSPAWAKTWNEPRV